LREEKIDVTLPGRGVRYGKVHPVTRVEGEICDIFSTLGFFRGRRSRGRVDLLQFRSP